MFQITLTVLKISLTDRNVGIHWCHLNYIKHQEDVTVFIHVSMNFFSQYIFSSCLFSDSFHFVLFWLVLHKLLYKKNLFFLYFVAFIHPSQPCSYWNVFQLGLCLFSVDCCYSFLFIFCWFKWTLLPLQKSHVLTEHLEPHNYTNRFFSPSPSDSSFSFILISFGSFTASSFWSLCKL